MKIQLNDQKTPTPAFILFCNDICSSLSKYFHRVRFNFYNCFYTTTHHKESTCVPPKRIIQIQRRNIPLYI
jgi:hypothetical protein